MQGRTRTILRTLGIVLAIPLILYAGLTIWSILVLRGAYADLARAGRPMSAADVIPPPVPAADNAAPLYEEAVRVLTDADGSSNSPPQAAVNVPRRVLRGGKQTRDTLLQALSDAARAATATNARPQDVSRFRELLFRPESQRALDLVVRAGDRRSCRFNLNYVAGPGIGLPNLSGLMLLSKVVRGEVARLCDAGASSNACRLAVAGLRLAEAQHTEPILVSHLVTIALAANADAAVRRLCAADPLSRDQYDSLLRVLLRMDQPLDFQRAMDGERLLFGEWAFAHVSLPHMPYMLSWDHAGSAWARRICLSLWGPMLRFDYATYLRVMVDAAAASPFQNPPPPRLPKYCPLTGMLVPALDKARSKSATSLARLRCTATGIAVINYWQEHGVWPASLAALAPPLTVLPKDPFDGQPLRYRVTEKGFAVYSVGKDGKDGKDDGGCADRDEVWVFSPEWAQPGKIERRLKRSSIREEQSVMNDLILK